MSYGSMTRAYLSCTSMFGSRVLIITRVAYPDERRFSILRAASTVPICFVNPHTLDGAYNTWFSVDFRTGRGGRVRTYECESQSLVPYHLATPLCCTHLNTPFSVCQVFLQFFCAVFEINFSLELYGATPGIRTQTVGILSAAPLPLG